jgi:hypothetical protein
METSVSNKKQLVIYSLFSKICNVRFSVQALVLWKYIPFCVQQTIKGILRKSLTVCRRTESSLINVTVVVRNSVIQFHLHSLPRNFLRMRACTKHSPTQTFLEILGNKFISFTASLIHKRLHTPYYTYYSPEKYKCNVGFVLLIFSDANDGSILYKKLQSGGLLITVCVALLISLRIMHKTSV